MAAVLGQLLAHRWSQRRERDKLLSERLSIAIDAAFEGERRLHGLTVAYAKAIGQNDATIVADGAGELVDATEGLSAAWARYSATPGSSDVTIGLFERIDALLVLSVSTGLDLTNPLARHHSDKLRDVAARVRVLTSK